MKAVYHPVMLSDVTFFSMQDSVMLYQMHQVVNLDSNYETDKMLSEYAEFHYGESYFDVPNFQKAIAHIAIEKMGDKTAKHALDLGCAVGRASFELARHFDQVTGIDFSARLNQSRRAAQA